MYYKKFQKLKKLSLACPFKKKCLNKTNLPTTVRRTLSRKRLRYTTVTRRILEFFESSAAIFYKKTRSPKTDFKSI